MIQAAPGDSDEEDRYPANQSLDMFSSWLTARQSRLKAVREQFSNLHRRMRDLAGDHGWTFAGRVYADKMFEGHGFCAQNIRRMDNFRRLEAGYDIAFGTRRRISARGHDHADCRPLGPLHLVRKLFAQCRGPQQLEQVGA